MSTPVQYVVGGAVRDVVLGLRPRDIDYVWVGATPEYMLAKGMSRVGADFPVFLDADGREHALARQERKTGAGYNGFECTFDPSVSIEDDLFRRDLTCNAMAVRFEDWNRFVETYNHDLVIDPYKGLVDLTSKTLRHVSEHFAEDPLRVLRTARFHARYGYIIAPTTMQLMKKLVASGEMNHLTTERVWAEFQKGMMEKSPSSFLEAMSDCGALDVLFPELQGKRWMLPALERAAAVNYDFDVRFSVSGLYMTDVEFEQLVQRLKVSNKDIWITTCARKLIHAMQVMPISVADAIKLFTELRAWQNPGIMDKMWEIVSIVDGENFRDKYMTLRACFNKALPVNFDSLTPEQKSVLKGFQIGEAIGAMRAFAATQACYEARGAFQSFRFVSI